MNHDISIGEMIDAEDDLQIGLLGRDINIQFVRLAAAFNDKKRELAAATKERDEARAAIASFVKESRWAHNDWKNQPHVKPLFDMESGDADTLPTPEATPGASSVDNNKSTAGENENEH